MSTYVDDYGAVHKVDWHRWMEMPIEEARALAAVKTPAPAAGTWTLIGPDGRQSFAAESPMSCVRLEQAGRVPVEVALARIRVTMEEPVPTASKFGWEDLLEVVEANPGLLKRPAALRQRLATVGKMTLAELLQWQAREAQ